MSRPSSLGNTQNRRSTQPMAQPTAAAGSSSEADPNTTFLYRGHEDDRPLLWRSPLNQLVGALNELMVKRKKRLGPVLSKAAALEDRPNESGDDDELPTRKSRPASKRGSRRPDSKHRSGSPRDSYRKSDPQADGEVPYYDSRRSPRQKSGPGSRPQSGGRQDNDRDDRDDYEEVDDNDDDYEDLGDEDFDEEGADGEIRSDKPGGDEVAKERKALKRELQRVRAQITSDDVILRLRKQQSAELSNSAMECEESIEQARSWIKALEDVLEKRSTKLKEHDAKLTKAVEGVAECERALELLDGEEKRSLARHIQDQASLSNTVKIEHKTHEQWRSLEEELRKDLKEVEGKAAEHQKEQLRLTKHLQDLIVGEQEVTKRLAAQKQIGKEIEDQGVQLHKYWRREYLDAEMQVNAAAAEVEAEERARSHLVGHGDRIRAKLESATGNLTAQMTIIEEQGKMDSMLKDQTDVVERQMREVQLDIDEREAHKAALERQRDEVQVACQDKVEHLNSSLRAIETSAGAVATEQAIAQRTLSSSEEALETLEESEARMRLEEDIDALRRSLQTIEQRLHEVQKERAAVRETRARTQKDALVQINRVNGEIEQVDRLVEALLAQRVQLEVEQREIDGKRVVVHSRVKQSKKAVTPLEQERKLYLAKMELQERLQALRERGSAQLQEQSEDEVVVRDGIRALSELKDKVTMHREHVEKKLEGVRELIAQHEAEAQSLSATAQAMESKMAEAEAAAADAEERRQAEQADYEGVSLERRGRIKDFSARFKKEERARGALEEARVPLEAEVDEVLGQLSDQRHAAHNAAAQATTLKGEKEALDRLIAETSARLEKNSSAEEALLDRIGALRRKNNPRNVSGAYGGPLDH